MAGRSVEKPNTTTMISSAAAAQSMTQRGGVPQRKRHGRGSKTVSTPTPAPAPTLSTSTSQAAPGPSKKTLAVNITWEGRHTDMLVAWITSHSADCHILFHDHSSSASASRFSQASKDRPSGKNKKDVSAAIAKHIFETDPDHANTYVEEPGRYVMSVIN